MIEIVLFDLDGTLVDNTAQIKEAYQKTLEKLGLETTVDLGGIIGSSMATMLDKLKVPSELHNTFSQKYSEIVSQQPAPVINGLHEMLAELSARVKMGIVTSKLCQTTDQLLHVHGLRKYFSVIITSEDVSQTKPHPEPIIIACQQLGTEANRAVVFVGDKISDIEAANRGGVLSIGVKWGVDGDRLRSMADYFCSTPGDLIHLLRTLTVR